MILTSDDYKKLSKKLESRFKKSGHQIIDKINNEQVLTNEELSFLLGKLEYSFRKSNDELVDRISKETGKSPIKQKVAKS